MCEWTRHTLKICYGHSLFYFSQYVDYKKQKKPETKRYSVTYKIREQ